MIRIKIPSTGQIGDIKTDLDLKSNQEILAKVDDILEIGAVLCLKNCGGAEIVVGPEIQIVRALDEQDQITKKDLKEKARAYLVEAQEKAYRHSLDIRILDADLSFDEKKLTFYFSAENRVDFRSLVSDMVGSFGKIIRLQQVGSREEAKLFGGFGRCGRPLCCATFLNNLEGVSLKTAGQDTGGAKAGKMAGCCGKLMCCLTYEADWPVAEVKRGKKAEAKV